MNMGGYHESEEGHKQSDAATTTNRYPRYETSEATSSQTANRGRKVTSYDSRRYETSVLPDENDDCESEDNEDISKLLLQFQLSEVQNAWAKKDWKEAEEAVVNILSKMDTGQPESEELAVLQLQLAAAQLYQKKLDDAYQTHQRIATIYCSDGLLLEVQFLSATIFHQLETRDEKKGHALKLAKRALKRAFQNQKDEISASDKVLHVGVNEAAELVATILEVSGNERDARAYRSLIVAPSKPEIKKSRLPPSTNEERNEILRQKGYGDILFKPDDRRFGLAEQWANVVNEALSDIYSDDLFDTLFNGASDLFITYFKLDSQKRRTLERLGFPFPPNEPNEVLNGHYLPIELAHLYRAKAMLELELDLQNKEGTSTHDDQRARIRQFMQTHSRQVSRYEKLCRETRDFDFYWGRFILRRYILHGELFSPFTLAVYLMDITMAKSIYLTYKLNSISSTTLKYIEDRTLPTYRKEDKEAMCKWLATLPIDNRVR